jgi:NTP pyrophosphatase (non-canonical NTP hydrolase)
MTKYMNLQETGWMIHRTAKDKGFYDAEIDINFILSKIALLHSECSEVLEAVRKDRGSEVIMEEVADTFIRLADLVEAMKDGGIVDEDALLHDAIEDKMIKNEGRGFRHGVLA